MHPPRDFPGPAIESVQTRRSRHPESSILGFQGRADDVAAQSGGIFGIVLVVDRLAGGRIDPVQACVGRKPDVAGAILIDLTDARSERSGIAWIEPD